MVLEDFGGQSLDRLRTDRSIDLLTFLEIAYAASTALAALHERGIIHGNVSPSNIVFNTQNGQLKLIDFGCAIDLSDKRAASNKYRSSGDEWNSPTLLPSRSPGCRRSMGIRVSSGQWARGSHESSQAHRTARGRRLTGLRPVALGNRLLLRLSIAAATSIPLA